MLQWILFPKAEVASSNLAGGTRVLLDETYLGAQLKMLPGSILGSNFQENFFFHVLTCQRFL
jgi:hypothetical protein